MASRAFWKGYLKLSLVTCPVAMTPATSESERVRFHTLNRVTGSRIEARYVDAETGKPVREEDEAKAYQTGPDDYVVLEDDELDSVALESTRTIDIETFVPADTIGWIWYDKPHFLVPDDKVGEEAFSVIRAAMAATGTVGISRLVLYRRERAVLLEPRDNGIVLWTLRFGDEVRASDDLFEAANDEPGEEMLGLVERLIERRTRDWDDSLASDPVQENLQKIIAAKKKGRKASRPKIEAEEAPGGNVISIMDALKKSLASEKEKSGKAR
ncbi:Ku protein [Ancylobacter sp. 6x-1]|uniref:Non-homologous end joining protein Ku n=1 Tax=Ancylobacter crimeensis TaxID=2579147 RepID=A0ABT0D784_9HYPH|nr:Ku protein [Ancylobacter crimeensis]MCK0195811.1 Ku protein [Ancylobacter crimeensis]